MQSVQLEADVGRLASIGALIGLTRMAGLMMSLRSAAIAGDDSNTPVRLPSPPATADNTSAMTKVRFRIVNMAPTFHFDAGCPEFSKGRIFASTPVEFADSLPIGAAPESGTERFLPRRLG